ncbi:MAG: DUF3237 domain-containing protein [Sneathiellaceae bacterium]
MTAQPRSLAGRFLMDLEAWLDPPHLVAETPAGGRKIVTVHGGSFQGPRLKGRILPHSGADWALTRPDGVLLLDVRLTLETDDGALIFMTYRGMRHGPDAVMKRMSSGERVDPAEYYFRIQPWFETASPDHAYLNRMVCVGLGDRLEKGPKYTIHEVL